MDTIEGDIMEYSYREELYHYGLKGMKWGQRRWQNEDGTFNNAGKERYFSNGGGDNYQKIGRSVKGNARRALAKVYEINEKFYSKNGRNKTLASMNKAAKNEQLKKAEEADRAKAEKKALKNANKQKIGEKKAIKVTNKNGSRKVSSINESTVGIGRKVLAKVYDINERYYSKHGNETMASMNRAAKEQMLNKR